MLRKSYSQHVEASPPTGIQAHFAIYALPKTNDATQVEGSTFISRVVFQIRRRSRSHLKAQKKLRV